MLRMAIMMAAAILMMGDHDGGSDPLNGVHGGDGDPVDGDHYGGGDPHDG
jgi:hypothetical protein